MLCSRQVEQERDVSLVGSGEDTHKTVHGTGGRRRRTNGSLASRFLPG